MFEKGIFNSLFDLNGDGKLNDFERAIDLAFFIDLVKNVEESGENDEK